MTKQTKTSWEEDFDSKVHKGMIVDDPETVERNNKKREFYAKRRAAQNMHKYLFS